MSRLAVALALAVFALLCLEAFDGGYDRRVLVSVPIGTGAPR